MATPFKKIITFDYETGGLDSDVNPPTELAMVAIDVATLEIVDEFTVMFKPRLDISFIDRNLNFKFWANKIFTGLSYDEVEDGKKLKRLAYKGELITPRTVGNLIPDIESFYNYLNDVRCSFIIEYDAYLEMLNSEHKDIAELLFNFSYNPQALSVTHMSIEMLLKEGVSIEEGYKLALEFVETHTHGANKPILAGHNIKKFDNPFLIKGFFIIGIDIMKKVNDFMYDTLEMARLRLVEISSYSLGIVANALGLTLKEAHRALPDTIANAKVLIAMVKNLRGEGQGESEYVRKKFNLNY